MSNYPIQIICPKCGPEAQPGTALDDYFAKHVYGYQCHGCGRIFKDPVRIAELETIGEYSVFVENPMHGVANEKSSSEPGGKSK